MSVRWVVLVAVFIVSSSAQHHQRHNPCFQHEAKDHIKCKDYPVHDHHHGAQSSNRRRLFAEMVKLVKGDEFLLEGGELVLLESDELGHDAQHAQAIDNATEVSEDATQTADEVPGTSPHNSTEFSTAEEFNNTIRLRPCNASMQSCVTDSLEVAITPTTPPSAVSSPISSPSQHGSYYEYSDYGKDQDSYRMVGDVTYTQFDVYHYYDKYEDMFPSQTSFRSAVQDDGYKV